MEYNYVQGTHLGDTLLLQYKYQLQSTALIWSTMLSYNNYKCKMLSGVLCSLVDKTGCYTLHNDTLQPVLTSLVELISTAPVRALLCAEECMLL